MKELKHYFQNINHRLNCKLIKICNLEIFYRAFPSPLIIFLSTNNLFLSLISKSAEPEGYLSEWSDYLKIAPKRLLTP